MLNYIFILFFLNIFIFMTDICLAQRYHWHCGELVKNVLLFESVSLLIAVTLFPVPLDDTASIFVQENNFVPFRTIGTELKNLILSHDITSFVRQFVGNLFMFFGFMNVVYFYLTHISWKKACALTLVFSLLVEGFQGISNILMEINYRSIDIDDIILNTAGGVIGFLFYEKFLKKLSLKLN